MNTLIMNMTRFGDLLQTQPLISGLKKRGDSVGLVCLDNFRGAAELLDQVDYIHGLPGARLLSMMDKNWPESLIELNLFRTSLEQGFRPQSYLNLTASMGGRLLQKFLALKGEEKRQVREEGFFLDENGFSRTPEPWVDFLLACSKNRGSSPFNLVDLFWKAAGMGDEERVNRLKGVSPEAASKASQMLQAGVSGLGDSLGPRVKGFIGLQLGASANRRRWPVSSFATLGRILWEKRGLCPVIFGGKSEAGLGRKFEKHNCPHVNLIGKTSLPELGGALKQMSLLVSNDTGTMHLAAGLGVPVAAIFLATAQPWDTGPYKEHNLCLEPDLDCHPCQFGNTCRQGEKCRGAIDPGFLAKAVDGYLERGDWEQAVRNLPGSGARVWETRVQEGYFMGLVSLSGRENDDRTQWIGMQRTMYRHFLDRDWTGCEPRQGSGLSRAAEEKVKLELNRAEMLLNLLLEQGRVLAVRPLPQMKGKFMASWQRLQALWSESEYFCVLGHLWMSQSQEAGQDLASILQLAAQYQELVKRWRKTFV